MLAASVPTLAAEPQTVGPGRFTVRHQQIAALGGEHIAHAIYRQTQSGGSIIGWGERVVEWPLDNLQMREVVPRQGDLRFYNGGCALDVTGDGKDEIIVPRGKTRAGRDPDLLWLEEAEKGQAWTIHRIESIGPGPIAPHDVVPFSASLPDGQRVRGVVAVLDRQRLVWYEIPSDPREAWPRHPIGDLPRRGQSGIAVGDLAGNGRLDVACGMYWAECPPDPTKDSWKVRRFGHFDVGGWGGMAKLAIADIDHDGRQDIIASEAEIPEAKLGIFSRDPAQPEKLWKYREVDTGLYCPHSLVLADLDGNGLTDIVTGEMTAGGWSFARNPRPRIIAYLSQATGAFQRQELAAGLGVHEMGFVPPSGEGKMSVFAADEIQPQKFPEMQTHVSLWTIERASK